MSLQTGVHFLIKLSMFSHLVTSQKIYYVETEVGNCTYATCHLLNELGKVTPSTNESSVKVLLQSGMHVMPTNYTLKINNFSKITITSMRNNGDTSIHCQENATIIFQNIASLNISLLQFVFCSLKIVYENVDVDRYATYIGDNTFKQSQTQHAVQVYDFTNTEVVIETIFEKCKFLQNEGAIYVEYIYQYLHTSEEMLKKGKVLVIADTFLEENHNPQGVVLFKNTQFTSLRNHFVHNDGSSIQGYFSNLQVAYSNFINNTCSEMGSTVNCLSCSITLLSSNFKQNSNDKSGMITAKLGTPPLYLMAIYFCTFQGNNGNGKGGALYIENIPTSIFQSYFLNNSATSGGAIYASSRNENIFIHNSTFSFNQAYKDGGALYCDNKGTIFLNASGTSFLNVAGERGGFAYLSNCDLNIISPYTVKSNRAYQGGAVYAASSDITLTSDVLIDNNTAEQSGGGLYLVTSSMYSAQPMKFNRNSVTSREGQGGAIFVSDNNCNLAPNPFRCFFSHNSSNNNSTFLIFVNNSASDGAVLYGGLLDRCITGYEYNFTSGIKFFKEISQYPPTPQALSSDPSRVCLCINGTTNCDLRNTALKLIRGQEFNLHGIVVDQDKSPKSSIIAASYVEPEAKLGEGEGRKSTGSRTCSMLTYHIFTTSASVSLLLRPEGYCDHSNFSMIKISISLQPCRRGWEVNGDRCVCDRRLAHFNITSCNITADSVKKNGPIWLMYDDQYLQEHSYCPLDYCKVTSDVISLARPDEQCANYRSGVLCGKCQGNYSIVLGSTRCLQCKSTYNFLWLIPLFAVAGIVLVVLLIVCNLSVSHGTLNGLILYANVLSVSGLTSLQNCSIHPVLSLFIAWINLDFGVETCFYSGMDTYQKVWLQLAFPLYIWLMMAAIILACYYSSTAMKIFGSNNITILATLFLLSYTKILVTIITALTFTQVLQSTANNVTAELIPYHVWTVDGNIKYVNGKHMALFGIAMALLVFLFIPYTLSLIFGQCIRSLRSGNKVVLRCIHSTLFISIMDAYHAPYHKTHRYWTGLLLVMRCFLFLSFTIFYGGNRILINMYITCLFIVSTLILKIFIKEIYKTCFNNILEVSFFLNLLVLSITLCYLVSKDNGSTEVCKITNFSISMALFTFVVIMMYHFHLKIRQKTFYKRIIEAIAAKIIQNKRSNDTNHQQSERELQLLD